MALAIFAIGMVSVLALFPIAIYAQRRMIDNTRSGMITREAIHTLRANRVAYALSPLSTTNFWNTGGGIIENHASAGDAIEYPGWYDPSGAATYPNLHDAVLSTFSPATAQPMLDIDGYYGAANPQGWEYVWTTWNEDVAPSQARPDAWPNMGVTERPFSNYGWMANIYQEDPIPVGGSTAYRYRVQIAVFRGYDAISVTLTSATRTADNDPANHNKGYIEVGAADALLIDDALLRDRGYVRITNPLDRYNQLWYRIEAVHRRAGPARDRMRIVLAEPLRGTTVLPVSPTVIEVSEDLVHMLDTVIMARP